MANPVCPKDTADIPAQVFEAFLTSLKTAGISDDLVTRFRNTLLEERAFSEVSLKKAVFGERPTP